jgi:hypothetical protein
VFRDFFSSCGEVEWLDTNVHLGRKPGLKEVAR